MTEPTDNEIDALVAAYLGDCGPQATRVYSFARAVLAKWGTLRAEKIVIPTDTMAQEFQKHYRRGYEAGKKAAPQPTQAADSVQEDAARYRWLREGNDAKHGAAWHIAVNLYGCEWDAAIDAAARLEIESLRGQQNKDTP